MCDVAVPLPKCATCVAEEQAELREKLSLTTDHSLITARLEQLEEDALLTDDAMAALEEERLEAVRVGTGLGAVQSEQSRRYDLLRERKLQARDYLPREAGVQDFRKWDMETLLSDTWAFNPSPAVRRRLAGNPTLPVGVLAVLARDHDRDVLGRVMENPNAEWVCFFRVAGNPHAKGGMAEILCGLKAMFLPETPEENPAVDAAMADLTLEEKLQVVRFLNS